MKRLLTIVAILFTLTCSAQPKTNIAKEKRLVIKTEEDFAKMLAEKGAAAAFYFYADSNVVINRGNDSLSYGRAGVQHYYSKPA